MDIYRTHLREQTKIASELVGLVGTMGSYLYLFEDEINLQPNIGNLLKKANGNLYNVMYNTLRVIYKNRENLFYRRGDRDKINDELEKMGFLVNLIPIDIQEDNKGLQIDLYDLTLQNIAELIIYKSDGQTHLVLRSYLDQNNSLTISVDQIN